MEKEPQLESRAEKLASGVKTAGTAVGMGSLLRNLLGLVIVSVIMLLLMSWGIPAYFGVTVILIMVGLVVMDVLRLKQTVGVDLYELNETEPGEIPLKADENAVLWIPGVMQVWKTRSAVFLDTGKVLTTENALLLSSKGIWALTVPLPGADQVISGTDIGKWQWMNAWQDIADKLDEMVTADTLEEVLRKCRGYKICSLEQISEIKFSDLSQGITIKLKDKKPYTYSIRDKATYLKAQKSFALIY